MPRYIVESHEPVLQHAGKTFNGVVPDPSYASGGLYLYEIELSIDPAVVADWAPSGAGKAKDGPRRAPYKECPWWVVVRGATAHWPGDPSRRSTGNPIG
jgi:hypothetical protein